MNGPARSANPGAASLPEIPDEFRTLDFARLWRGRHRTSEVESELVTRGLSALPAHRVFEVGTGDGRLTTAVRSVAREYVGIDQNVEFLERLRARLPPSPTCLLVEANAYHLPFVEGTATSLLLARVYNFLVRPDAALAELNRVLSPGGGLVVTCNVRPSVGSLVDDLRLSLHRSAGERVHWSTFDRSPVLPSHPSEFPAWAPRRNHLRMTLDRAGFVPVARFGSGLEDFRGVRALRAAVFVGAGSSLGRAPVFPLAWEVARRGSATVSPPLPTLSSTIACPRCRRAFGELPLGLDFERECSECGFQLRHEGGILRARYAEG